MTPPRHDKTPLPKALTDSQRDLVAVAVEETLHRQSSEELEMPRATPKPSETTDMAAEALAWQRCKTAVGAPAFELGRRVDDHENRIKTMETAREREAGAQQWRGRVVAGFGVLGVLSGIAVSWYTATHTKAQAATVDVAAELQALRAELKRHPQPTEQAK